MNIFSEIEGLSGENLGSALLKYLLINSQEVRSRFLDYLSDNSPVGPFGYSAHFGCQTEFSTSDENNESGRIDLLIQTDDIVIGVENKFYATFQKNQPAKYMKDIEHVASAMAKIYRKEPKYLVFILCPESRTEEAKRHVSDQQKIGFVTWEGVLAVLKDAKSSSDISDPVIRSILNEFVKYIEEYFSFVRGYEKKLSHYYSLFPDYGDAIHAELTGKLHPLFYKAGPRLSYSKDWVGYYFYDESRKTSGHSGWYGFVRRSLIVSPPDFEATFVVASTYKPNYIDPKYFKEIELVHKNFSGNRQQMPNYYWSIDLKQLGSSKDSWRKALEPFYKDPSIPD